MRIKSLLLISACFFASKSKCNDDFLLNPDDMPQYDRTYNNSLEEYIEKYEARLNETDNYLKSFDSSPNLRKR